MQTANGEWVNVLSRVCVQLCIFFSAWINIIAINIDKRRCFSSLESIWNGKTIYGVRKVWQCRQKDDNDDDNWQQQWLSGLKKKNGEKIDVAANK